MPNSSHFVFAVFSDRQGQGFLVSLGGDFDLYTCRDLPSFGTILYGLGKFGVADNTAWNGFAAIPGFAAIAAPKKFTGEKGYGGMAW